MPKVIGVVQLKGGVGKTTLSINLAAALSGRRKVGILDADGQQGTATSWYAIREGLGKAESLKLATVSQADQISDALSSLSDCDIVVIDSPPRLEETFRTILMMADMVICPIGAMAAEFWAASDTVAQIGMAQQFNAKLTAATMRTIWTRYRGTADERLIVEEGQRTLPLKPMTTVLGYRAAYSDSLARGLSVLEWVTPKAREEMEALTKEVLKSLRLK